MHNAHATYIVCLPYYSEVCSIADLFIVYSQDHWMVLCSSITLSEVNQAVVGIIE